MDSFDELKLLRVLYIEDEEVIRKSIAKTLTLLVGEVYVASNVEEGYKFYHEYQPNLILSDVRLPDGSGLELARTIRTKDSKTPIIILSAYTDKELLLEAVKLNLIEYSVKPIDFNRLVRVLQEAFQSIQPRIKEKIVLGNGMIFDPKGKVLLSKNDRIMLTQKEWEFLHLLIEYSQEIVPVEIIEHSLWADEVASEAAFKSLVFKLRQKIGKETLQNFPKMGYKLLFQREF